MSPRRGGFWIYLPAFEFMREPILVALFESAANIQVPGGANGLPGKNGSLIFIPALYRLLRRHNGHYRTQSERGTKVFRGMVPCTQ